MTGPAPALGPLQLTAGQGMPVPRVGYLARSLCNRYRPEISHTSLDLFRNYRAIPEDASSDRKTTNGQNSNAAQNSE